MLLTQSTAANIQYAYFKLLKLEMKRCTTSVMFNPKNKCIKSLQSFKSNLLQKAQRENQKQDHEVLSGLFGSTRIRVLIGRAAENQSRLGLILQVLQRSFGSMDQFIGLKCKKPHLSKLINDLMNHTWCAVEKNQEIHKDHAEKNRTVTCGSPQ